MAVTNLHNDHLSDTGKTKLTHACNELAALLGPLKRGLTPEERQAYGSIAEQNKLAVIKVLDMEQSHPALKSPKVDYTELRKDWEDRTFLASLVSRLQDLTDIVNTLRIMHDYDAWNSAKSDYDYTKYMLAEEHTAEWENKYNTLLEFYKTYAGKKPESAGDAA